MTTAEAAEAFATGCKAMSDRLEFLEKCRVMLADMLHSLCDEKNREYIGTNPSGTKPLFTYIDNIKAKFEALDSPGG